MGLAGGGSRRKKKSRKQALSRKLYLETGRSGPNLTQAFARSHRDTALDLVLSKTVKGAIMAAKKKSLPRLCAEFRGALRLGVNAADKIRSKRMREAAEAALETQIARGDKAGCKL